MIFAWMAFRASSTLKNSIVIEEFLPFSTPLGREIMPIPYPMAGTKWIDTQTRETRTIARMGTSDFSFGGITGARSVHISEFGHRYHYLGGARDMMLSYRNGELITYTASSIEDFSSDDRLGAVRKVNAFDPHGVLWFTADQSRTFVELVQAIRDNIEMGTKNAYVTNLTLYNIVYYLVRHIKKLPKGFKYYIANKEGLLSNCDDDLAIAHLMGDGVVVFDPAPFEHLFEVCSK